MTTQVTCREIKFDHQLATFVNGVPMEIGFERSAYGWFLAVTVFGKKPDLFNVKFDVELHDRISPSLNLPDDPELYTPVAITLTLRMGQDTIDNRSGIQYLINNTELKKCPTQLEIALGLMGINRPTLRALAKTINKVIFLIPSTKK